jgi:serine/threonine protein kinase
LFYFLILFFNLDLQYGKLYAESDIYSVGGIAFEMMTRIPFEYHDVEAPSPEHFAKMAEFCGAEWKQGLEEFMTRALHKDPRKRRSARYFLQVRFRLLNKKKKEKKKRRIGNSCY